MALLALAAVLVAAGGCSIPTPKKVDTSAIPVYTKTQKPGDGSLWAGETSMNTLFQDFRARNVGDILTVLVSENTSATEDATTVTARKTNTDASISSLLGLPLNLAMKNFLMQKQPFSPSFKSEYINEFDGDGETTRSGSFKTTIAVRVVEVLPNGNLVIEGKKEARLNDETKYIVLSGLVRPIDISTDNTVLSSKISDSRLEYSGSGVISDEQRPGWLARALDNVWPF
ncbi:Flagellar L-ring protein FlgH [hydrothermal vent metagenome]|uniref:Flagellar L-ring protein FlgH n=1 Tax=hydrothermal vent metagenome TaxID=652676 RepID=A0A3B0V9R4_9ZZZZ